MNSPVSNERLISARGDETEVAAARTIAETSVHRFVMTGGDARPMPEMR